MKGKCFFCGRPKNEVPAMVANERNLVVCSLCLEDCLALFCQEGVGITRFIVAEQNSSGKIEIRFPRPKKNILLDTVASNVFEFATSISKIFEFFPFVKNVHQQIKICQDEILRQQKQKADLEDQLKGVETKSVLLQQRLQRLKEKLNS